MYLTSNFEKMMSDILASYSDYSDREYITFGILIVDPRQPDTKAHITNYFSRFDTESAGYFNFFIPGFRRGENPDHDFKVRGVEHNFDDGLLDSFCDEFCRRFNIAYPYNPTLILMTMQKSDINTAEYIVFELGNNYGNNLHRVGRLFDEIFEIARRTPDLKNIQMGLAHTYIKSRLLNIIVSVFNKAWITEIAKTGGELARYRIRR